MNSGAKGGPTCYTMERAEHSKGKVTSDKLSLSHAGRQEDVTGSSVSL